MSHRPNRPRVLALLAILLMLAGVATPALSAQEASPVAATGSPAAAGEAFQSITRAEFEDQLRQTFGLQAPQSPGGTVIMGEPFDISTLNGALANNATTLSITGRIFETLVVSSPIDGQPAPGGLADRWEVAADGVTYTFHLNQDATWHDGADVTAADVVFTLDAQTSPDTVSPYGATVAAIVASYRAVDDDTVEIVSHAPSATFLIDLYLPIMPKHVWETVPLADWPTDPGSTGQDPARVVGSGPFIFQEWVQGDHVTLVRNPDYHGTVPTIDEFILQVLPDANATVQALQAGQIDIMPNVPPADVQTIVGGAADVAVYDTFEFDFYLYNLDPARTTLFQDAGVRRALFRALDRDAIDNSIYFGFGEPAVGPQPLLSIAYAPNQIETDNSFDPAAARQLLTAAGWTDSDGDGVVDQGGQPLAFELLTYDGEPRIRQLATYMQQAWADIGVEMTPVFLPLQDLIDTVAGQRDFEMAMLGFSWDATANQGIMFTCDGGFNVMSYCNPAYDALNKQQLHELDEARRIDLLIEQSNIIWADMPVGIIQFLEGRAGYGANLQNFHPNAYSFLWSLPYVWVEP